jgi:nucleoside-diphosphate-sugar epimerase
MAPIVAEEGYEVVGVDTGYFRQCTLVPDRRQVPWRVKDIRDLNSDDLRGFDAVIHLAALSNDPIGNLDEGWTRAINLEGSVRLAVLAKAAGVKRYLFSSSCIMYGMSEANEVDENSPLDPRTEYARSKVAAERTVSALAGDGFSPTFLRNGTLYGLSQRMRFDTVFNDLIGAGVTSGKIIVYSDGKPWRPVIHVSDAARAFLEILKAPVEKVHNQAFNVGANHLNHQVMELAEIAARTIPDCRLEIQAHAGADQRTYKADFTKFARTFPNFRFQWSAAEGARDLYESFRSIGLAERHFLDKRFTRLKWLNYLLENHKLGGALRWADDAREAHHHGGVL